MKGRHHSKNFTPTPSTLITKKQQPLFLYLCTKMSSREFFSTMQSNLAFLQYLKMRLHKKPQVVQNNLLLSLLPPKSHPPISMVTASPSQKRKFTDSRPQPQASVNLHSPSSRSHPMLHKATDQTTSKSPQHFKSSACKVFYFSCIIFNNSASIFHLYYYLL